MSATALDKQRVRRSFERAAPRYEQASFLSREVGERMSERLDLLRATPALVLDLGSGTGQDTRRLRARYPHCRVVELDAAFGMLAQSRDQLPWWQRGVQRIRGQALAQVCGDIEQLPFASGKFDMVWSNFALQWVDVGKAFAEIYRVLRPGGVCMFSTLGPDTLRELRSSYGVADRYEHVHPFIDLHDVGDMLVQARFADPVMDMEYIRVTYADVRALLKDLQGAGAGNANSGRAPGLSGKRGFQRMTEAYEAYREAGSLPATFEVVYGHAWRPDIERRSPGSDAVITFHPRQGPAR